MTGATTMKRANQFCLVRIVGIVCATYLAWTVIHLVFESRPHSRIHISHLTNGSFLSPTQFTVEIEGTATSEERAEYHRRLQEWIAKQK